MPLGSDHFLLRDRPCVKEGLHRRFSEAPASLMWPCLIVFADPHIDVDLQLVDRTIHLFSKRDPVELVEHGFVEALADAVGLRALCLGPRMIDVLNGKIKLVLMMLRIATIFRAPVGQHPAEGNAMAFEERQHTVVQDLGGGDRRLAIVKFGEELQAICSRTAKQLRGLYWNASSIAIATVSMMMIT